MLSHADNAGEQKCDEFTGCNKPDGNRLKIDSSQCVLLQHSALKDIVLVYGERKQKENINVGTS